MAKVIKKIYEWPYYLIENTVTIEEGDKIAKVKTKTTKTIDDIAERIVKERTEYRKDTIVNILKMANDVKLEFFAQGEMVNDGVVIFAPTITGNFYENTGFDDEKNNCVINTQVTGSVLDVTAQVKGTYSGLTVENGGASIDGVIDSTTGKTDGTITRGKVITVVGKKIRVVPEEGEPVQACIIFTNTQTGASGGITDALTINDPSKLVFQLPSLPPGTYTLTIKTLFSTQSTNLKAPRYITGKQVLTVF